MTGYGAPHSPRSRVEAGWREVSRYQELPAADRIDALVRATEIFADVYEAAPEMVPETLSAACAAICATRAGVPTDHIALHDEALDLLEEAERNHDVGTADQAIWRLVVVALAARDHPLLSGYLSHLGTAWVDRFRLTGRTADLDHAVARHEEALALPPTEPADRAGFRANYSSALRDRYEATGDARDLDRALELARESVRLAPDPGASALGRADRFALSTSLQSLTAALAARFKLDRDEAGLDEAIDVARRAVAVTSRSSPEYATVQALLANALLDRFARFWDGADLDDAVAAAAAGVTAAPAGSRARAVALSALALAQSNQFKHTGDVGYGDRAVATGNDSVTATGGDPVAAAVCLSNLGGILATRYQLVGDAGDLDRAVEAHRRAVTSTPGTYVHKAAFLSGLGNTLRSRFQVSGDLADISEAAEVLGQAVATAPATWLDRPGFVANLAEALIAAAERREDPPTLGRAAAIVREELRTLARDHPLRHLCLAAAGHAGLTVYDLTGDADALRQATGHWDEAAAAVSARHPQRADYLTALGAAWLREFDRSSRADRAAGAASAAASREAAGTSTAPALTRALAARNWAEAAAGLGDAQEATAGFAAAVDLLDRVAWHGLRRGDQERRLGRFTGLAGSAAAWAIQAGRPEQAVELLERGRGVLMAQALADRARRHDLLRDAPELAAQLDQVDDRLEAGPGADDLVPAAAAGPAWQEGLRQRREEVLARIRALPGHADFLRAPRFADISRAAQSGPVAIVNVSKYRCDALIVTRDGVRVVPLGGLTGDDVVRRAAAFLGALDFLDRDEDDPGKRRSAAETVTATLRWLWEAIASPLLPDLLAACAASAPGGAGAAAPRPRVWWCPTGPLTFLPLHAAGIHEGGDTLLDHVVSSYALTLRSLLHAQRRPTGAAGAAPVVVALPDTPGQSPLPGAGEEAGVVAGRFPGARQVRGAAATLDMVHGILAGSPRLAHFACHGVQDMTDPSSGRLELHDGALRILDVAGMRLDAAELAFLSACETAKGGFDLVDEAITVAAAFHLAGYRHVVGTLWSISDGLAPDVARRVYQALTEGAAGLDPGGTAAALDAAVRAHRNEPAWLWAPYIHLGP